MTRARSSASVALVVAAVAAAGCGGSSSSSPSTSSGGGGGGHAAVTIKGYAYHPAKLTIKAGTTVAFTNTDSSEHTATAKASFFDTGTLRQGGHRAIVFRKPGTYAYVCSFHPFMHGTIVVR